MTNADKIRSMADEELADTIIYAINIGKKYTDSRLGILNWLRQEAGGSDYIKGTSSK